MKKLLIGIMCFALLFSFTACGTDGQNDSTPNEQKSTSQAEKKSKEEAKSEKASDNGALGDYTVAIKDFRLVKDMDNKDAILIKYDFTNNGEEAEDFYFAVSNTIYQDGVELTPALLYDVKDYDPEQAMKKVKKGATITLEIGYVLSNLTSDVEVEVTELMNITDEKLVKTFKIA